MRRACALALSFALLFAGFPAVTFAAPQQSGQVTGTVQEEGGRLVGGYAVRIRNSANGQLLGTGVTDSEGRFTFANLPSGSYVVEAVDQAGSVPAVSAAITVAQGQMAVSGVVVTLPSDDAAALAKGNGNFFTSTKGLVIVAAAVAAGGAGIVAYRNNHKAKSKHKDKGKD